MAASVTLPLHAWAAPSSTALYSESNLGGGLWKYEYTLLNTSDPLANTGYDIYDFFLKFDSPVILTNIGSPAAWDLISDASSFIDWFSTMPGEPPVGADISPSGSLTAFSFEASTRLASLPFDVLFTNPADPANPLSVSGRTTTTAIPEPATLFLLVNGLIGLGYLKRRRITNNTG
jgi:hypothetical protein